MPISLPGSADSVHFECLLTNDLNNVNVVLTAVSDTTNWDRFDGTNPYHARATWSSNTLALSMNQE